MTRVLGVGVVNTIKLQDSLSGGEIHLYYRFPSPDEIISYRNGDTKRKGNKIIMCTGENRLKHGLKILTGFRDGDFAKSIETKPGSKPKIVPISSDPDSENYDKNWKSLVKAQASDLIESMAVTVFDQSATVVRPEDQAADEDEPENESIDDLEGNS